MAVYGEHNFFCVALGFFGLFFFLGIFFSLIDAVLIFHMSFA